MRWRDVIVAAIVTGGGSLLLAGGITVAYVMHSMPAIHAARDASGMLSLKPGSYLRNRTGGRNVGATIGPSASREQSFLT